jgi:hypothetical protein
VQYAAREYAVADAELPDVLSAVRELLRPGGLFFLGVYGGQADEGFAVHDWHEPPPLLLLPY